MPGAIPDRQRDSIHIIRNRIYAHKVLRINFTTYDMRRCQDSINPRNHPDIMLHAPTNDPSNHPYWYARVIGVFHALVSRRSHLGIGPPTPPRNVEFVWVRWFTLDTTAPGGFETRRLHRIKFISHEDENLFGFIDPNDIIRAVHLIGAFAFGRTKELLPRSIARQKSEKDEDWKYYYVNM